ncbi:hypothetical protein ACFL58_00605 [Elusimicrobiota bacterium]
MNRILTYLLSFLFIFAMAKTAEAAFASVSISTITMYVSFSGVAPPETDSPVITHKSLERISSLTRTVVTTGTVTDATGINSLSMHHWTDSNVTLSTETATITGSPTSYNFQFSLTVDNAASAFYYYFRSADISANSVKTSTITVSNIGVSQISSAGTNGGEITLPSGDQSHGNTSLNLPAGALAQNTNITITELSPSDSLVALGKDATPAVSAYRFDPAGLQFGANSLLTLLYSEQAWTGTQEENLRIMWWDGFEWRLVGGTVDMDANTVSAYIRHFSIYALFSIPLLTDDDYRAKEKIITPATIDGKNDFATFGGIGLEDTVNIYDIKGSRVRSLNGTSIWDGKDEDGDIVESGLYVYQIKVAGKIISGTIVVAK